MTSGTVPVRIGAKRYQALRKAAKRDGHSILWLLNYIVDLYLQDKQEAPCQPKITTTT